MDLKLNVFVSGASDNLIQTMGGLICNGIVSCYRATILLLRIYN